MNILAFSGSSRQGSLNSQALRIVTGMAEQTGASVTTLDLRELEIPIYDADLEAEIGLPPGAAILRERLLAANAIIIACPEYNGFMTPLLINAIDWASRVEGKRDLAPFQGKVILICSAAPSNLGGIRSASHLRTMLAGIGCVVLPQGLTVANAREAFTESGEFVDPSLSDRAGTLVARLTDMAQRLS